MRGLIKCVCIGHVSRTEWDETVLYSVCLIVGRQIKKGHTVPHGVVYVTICLSQLID